MEHLSPDLKDQKASPSSNKSASLYLDWMEKEEDRQINSCKESCLCNPLLPPIILHISSLHQQFLRDVSGVSDRTQKVYRYRARVVKLQKYIRNYVQCQHARVLVQY